MATLPFLLLLCTTAFAEPAPGRIPKVYNALITSNQNLEASKAFPVYQPVLQNVPYTYPLQTVYYGDLPLTNSLAPPQFPPAAEIPKGPVEPSASSETPIAPTEVPAPAETATEPDTSIKSNEATEAPPSPPKTEAPIPLNEFGLPPQVIPLGRFGSGYEYTQINSFPYSYPGLRFYDPYDAFGFHPYTNFPLFNRPLPNYFGEIPINNAVVRNQAPTVTPAVDDTQQPQAPPSEPGDLNILNYASKDPAIPNVPPPPLPQGGLKIDKE